MSKEKPKKLLFRTNINALSKVATKLAYSQSMTSRQIILGEKNQSKRAEAEQLIYKAMNILREIK